MRRLFSAWLTVVLLLVCAAAVAEPTVKNELIAAPVFWLAAPALADAEELTLAFDPEPAQLRVNLFAGSEALAASAERTEAGIRIKLLRPLRAEEELTFYADGTDANGDVFRHQFSWQVSLAGELALQAEALKALIARLDLPGRGEKCRVPAALDHLGVLRTVPLFTPVLGLEASDGAVRVRLRESSERWRFDLYSEDRMLESFVPPEGAENEIHIPLNHLIEGCSLIVDLLASQERNAALSAEFDYDLYLLAPKGCWLSGSDPEDAYGTDALTFPETVDTRYCLLFFSARWPRISAYYTEDGQLDHVTYYYFDTSKNDTNQKNLMEEVELIP